MSQFKKFLNAHAFKHSIIHSLISDVQIYSFSIHKLDNEIFQKIVYCELIWPQIYEIAGRTNIIGVLLILIVIGDHRRYKRKRCVY